VFDVLMAQLTSMRAQVDALIATVEMWRLLQGGEPNKATCPHFETENLGTFGAPDVRCKACGEPVNA
jgi:hypothetical protein